MIRSYEDKDSYIVEVEDNGTGFDSSLLGIRNETQRLDDTTSHVGLSNIRFRIKEITGGTLEVSSCPGKGTKVKVVFLKNKI